MDDIKTACTFCFHILVKNGEKYAVTPEIVDIEKEPTPILAVCDECSKKQKGVIKITRPEKPKISIPTKISFINNVKKTCRGYLHQKYKEIRGFFKHL